MAGLSAVGRTVVGLLVAAVLLLVPSAAGAQDYELIRAFGGTGSGAGEFSFPLGVTAGQDGTVYVADTFNHRIQSFDGEGNRLGGFGTEGSGPGEYSRPFDVELDEGGNLLVADAGNGRIQRIDTADGSFLGSFGEPGTERQQLATPTGVAPDGSGGAFVVDSESEHVHHYGADGSLLDVWGDSGTGPGQLSLPFDITLGPEGVYIADSANNRIQRFSESGEFLGEWGGLDAPQGIDRDPSGRIFVADSGNDRVRFFDAFGDPLGMWGVTGSEQGQFRLPRGIAADCAGRVYVTDVFNDRVQVFADLDAEPDPGACGLTLGELIERAQALDLRRGGVRFVVFKLRLAERMLDRGETERACRFLGHASRLLWFMGRGPWGSQDAELLRADLDRFMLQLGCRSDDRGRRGHSRIGKLLRFVSHLHRHHG